MPGCANQRTQVSDKKQEKRARKKFLKETHKLDQIVQLNGIYQRIYINRTNRACSGIFADFAYREFDICSQRNENKTQL
jgi:hypothetical protein